MAQAVSKTPTVRDKALTSGSFVTIPGLIIQVLTGSGWIFLTYLAGVYNGSGTVVIVYPQLVIDGVDYSDGLPLISAETAHRTIVSGRFPFKLGSGQHTITFQIKVSQASCIIEGTNALLLLEEPGY